MANLFRKGVCRVHTLAFITIIPVNLVPAQANIGLLFRFKVTSQSEYYFLIELHIWVGRKNPQENLIVSQWTGFSGTWIFISVFLCISDFSFYFYLRQFPIALEVFTLKVELTYRQIHAYIIQNMSPNPQDISSYLILLGLHLFALKSFMEFTFPLISSNIIANLIFSTSKI